MIPFQELRRVRSCRLPNSTQGRGCRCGATLSRNVVMNPPHSPFEKLVHQNARRRAGQYQLG